MILGACCDWVTSPPKNIVVVSYTSMHDSTRRMVEHFLEACAHRGVRAEQFNLAGADRRDRRQARGAVREACRSRL